MAQTQGQPMKVMYPIGGIILVFGVIFYLQGLSIVGPESSFMYANPSWINYGVYIAILGALVILGGLIYSKTRQ